jgi:hypothetical protein
MRCRKIYLFTNIRMANNTSSISVCNFKLIDLNPYSICPRIVNRKLKCCHAYFVRKNDERKLHVLILVTLIWSLHKNTSFYDIVFLYCVNLQCVGFLNVAYLVSVYSKDVYFTFEKQLSSHYQFFQTTNLFIRYIQKSNFWCNHPLDY